MSRTEKGTSTGWRAWCRRNIPDTIRERRDVAAVKADGPELESELDAAAREANLPDPCDGRGCPFCSENWQAEPLPEGVTVEPAPPATMLSARRMGDPLRRVDLEGGGVMYIRPGAIAYTDGIETALETLTRVRAGRTHVLIPAALELEDPNDPLLDDPRDELEDHSDCEQCTGYPPHDEWSAHYERIGYPDGYAADLTFVIDRGVTFGKLESQEPEAPCYGCRRGLRRAAVHWPEPQSECFEHVHLMRPGVTIECTGTAWRIMRLLAEWNAEDDHEQAKDLPG